MIVGVFLILLIVLIIMGIPLYACFAFVCTGIILTSGIGFGFTIPTIFTTLNSFTMMAIPFFVFAGGIMNQAGISEGLIKFANALVGRFKGGLGAVTILSCGFFGAISGSSGAAISGIGMAVLPELDKHGYNRKYSTALLACSGLLGQLIPPSVPLIMFGMITGTSVAACWLGVAVPGIILIFFYLIINYIRSKKMFREDISVNAGDMDMVGSNRPANIQDSKRGVDVGSFLKNIGSSIKTSYLSLLMPVIILGGIYGGIFTPTEAGAVGVAYAIIVGLIKKKLTLKNFISSSREVVSVLGSVTFIIMFILILSRLFTYDRLPMIMGEAIIHATSNRIIVLMLVNLLILLIGMFMDDISSMLICAPLFFPLFLEIGVSPIQMAAILAVNQGTGMLTPPVATNLYTASRIGGIPASDIIKDTIPFLLFGNIPVLILVTYIPEISLWLPRVLMGA